MKKTLKNNENIVISNKELDIWAANSEKIDLNNVKKNLISINSKEWNDQIKLFGEDNIKSPKIKEIIEILSAQ
ncbi:hypothetical protein [Spiroplasma floricola]|uniref:Uncharacterized protein n=1 Tax=Spiroplasma floricola 23-6 TaxID=1336749 RepID=A0A2K8SE59_9MOLU|nr:hypothetical protein [Spiroplasma floricola]AUB31746.1 hypothetical protein SFLOR_v1c06980 [Spiroplasma floricola 23-6]